MKTLNQRLKTIVRLADRLPDKNVRSAVRGALVILPRRIAGTTVPTITPEALERAIKAVVKFADACALSAAAAVERGDLDEASKQIELTRAGYDLINQLAELIS